MVLHINCHKDDELHNMVADYLRSELNIDVPKMEIESNDDAIARQILHKTVRHKNNQFEVRLEEYARNTA